MILSDHQKVIFLDRYSMRDKDNKPVETKPSQMWERVAGEIASNEEERTAFLSILQDWRFLPGGRILAGAGTESEKTFYNCFVIPVETRARRRARVTREDWHDLDAGSDSREAIFDTIGTMVDIMSRGGGVGINWSVLRPSGSYLVRISGTSSGPVGWMDVASTAVGEVIQGGSRRGAAMFMLDDWHPDVEKFIEAKLSAGRIENANISVAVSDAFMEAVQKDAEWEFRFPDTAHSAYNLEWDGDINAWVAKGYPVVGHGKVRARDMWARLAASAWKSGEPGVVFLDRYNKLSTAAGVERIISVNPCGEQGLGAYSVCNLGSMNLSAYVVESRFDWDRFQRDVRIAVRFLDNVIDKTYYTHEDTKRRQQELRRIGLGVMGLADALIKLGLRYGHHAAVEFTEKVFRAMKDTAISASEGLAAEHGPAGGWNDSMWDRPYLKEFADRRRLGRRLGPLRNLFLLTQAPTGTTASLAGVNSGIEPYFAFSYTREDRTGSHRINAAIVDWVSQYGDPSTLVTANDVSVEQHLLMQAAAQGQIDSSVSKTINAPNSQTEEEVLDAFTMAYELGLKGLAYYRDGSRGKQVLYRDDPSAKITALEARVAELEAMLPTGFDTMPFPVIALQMNQGCPVCGGKVVREEGCSKCLSCSWSAC